MPMQTVNGVRVAIGRVAEDGSFSILARVCDLDGTGSEVVPGEGPVLKQADITTITGKVWNLGANINNAAGTEVAPAPTVTISTSVFDTLRTAGWPLREDTYGYNFRHDLNPTYSADANTWYKVEYKFALASGGTVWVFSYVKTGGTQT